MNILALKHIPGPNIYNHRPVMTMTIDLEDRIDTESSQLPEFVAGILRDLPGLHQHGCSRGHAGGFVERLNEGTYLGHIIEHIALELSEPAGINASYGKTVYAGAPGHYRIVIECVDGEFSEHLLRSAYAYVEAKLAGTDYDLAAATAAGQRIAARNALGPSTKAIVDAAIRRGIPWRRCNERSLIQLGYGQKRRFIQATQSWMSRSIAVDISCDKALTKDLLANANIPVPHGRVVRSADAAKAAWRSMAGEVAIKPLDGNQGKGVSLRVDSEDAAAAAFEIAAQYSSKVIVEEMLTGDDFRLIVVGGRLIAAAKRLPPEVVGDGRSSLVDLVAQANEDPRRGEGHEKPMTKIVIDEIAKQCLARQGLSPGDVSAKGAVVRLRDNTNLSTGGIAIDVTDQVHPTIKRICERAADTIGLDICGIDLLADDITAPLGKTNGIVELNAAPGIRMHHYPAEGSPRDVGAAIVDMLYPRACDGRIPIFSVTGTNGKTTTTRMIAHVMQATGKVVGTTSTGGIWINRERIAEGDTTGPRSARTVLSDPTVEVAVLETARGGLIRNGLGYDWSDVGIITNVHADHIGQDGIEDEDDILHAKALVAERVKAGGTIVLNAADARLARLPEMRCILKQKLERHIVFFALNPRNEALQAHLQNGGTGYYLHDGRIMEAKGLNQTTPMLSIAAIPATLGGAALFQVENLLAAVAGLRSQHIDPALIEASLATFDSEAHNPGRMNLFKVGRGFVLLDYGHNPQAFAAVSQTASTWSDRLTGIISLPGDRSTEMIEAAALAAAAGFDRVIIKEDLHSRGRQPGETASITQLAIQRAEPEQPCLIISQEAKALHYALETMRPGEIIAHFYDDLAAVMACLEQWGATKASLSDLQPKLGQPALRAAALAQASAVVMN